MPSQSQYDDEFFKIAATLEIKQPRNLPGRYTWLPSALVIAATLAIVLLGTIVGGPMLVVAVVAFGGGTLLAARLFPTARKVSKPKGRKQSRDLDIAVDEN